MTLLAKPIVYLGTVGAAIASIITQFFTNVVLGFVYKPIRKCNYLMLKGLNPKITLDLLTNLRNVNGKRT